MVTDHFWRIFLKMLTDFNCLEYCDSKWESFCLRIVSCSFQDSCDVPQLRFTLAPFVHTRCPVDLHTAEVLSFGISWAPVVYRARLVLIPPSCPWLLWYRLPVYIPTPAKGLALIFSVSLFCFLFFYGDG